MANDVGIEPRFLTSRDVAELLNVSESQVYALMRSGDLGYPFRYDGRDRSRGGPRARRVARQAHKKYWALVNAYDAHGYNGRVHRITKRQLKRAANAMADLITSLR